MQPTPREAELLAIIQQKDERIALLEKENALLRQKLDLILRKLFGAQSEKLSPEQLLLLLQGEEQGKESTPEANEAEIGRCEKASPKPRKERESRWPENLIVVETILDPEPVKADPQAWRFIGEEVSEQLDYEPAQFIRRRLIRRKYVQRREVDAVPIIAPPPMLQERCTVTPGLIAQILVGKYCDHLPFYRQEQIFNTRHGVWLPRQNMTRWAELAADWLKPIYEQIRIGVMDGGYVQVDETPINYLDPGHGKTRQGYLWVYSKPGGDVLFDWQTSRASTCLDDIIQYLYRVESSLRERGAGPNLRAAERAWKSAPVQDRIYQAMIRLKQSRRHLPQSLMGKAIDYALGQWSTLQVWLTDGRVQIDNNLVENSIRPSALGKKNWLFIGEAEAGDRGAILYTVIESCRRRGIDPLAYLRDVLTRLPSMTNWQIKDVTPKAWAKSNRCSPLQSAA